MNYNNYFKKLIEKNEIKKNKFPNEKVFIHANGKYHLNAFTYENVKYNFVISSKRSIAYGDDFEGLIVEIYIDNDYCESYFNQLKENQNSIEKDLNIENIVWQSPRNTFSGNVSRIFAKHSVDVNDNSRWDEYIDWQINTMIKFLDVMPKYTRDLNKSRIMNMNKDKDKDNKIKNIILYGAPGVGKTHNYQNIISMIEDGKSQKEIFDTITDNTTDKKVEQDNEIFQNIKDDKRVEFVTFHQSYSYEDFIEGFRPNEDGKIKLEDGVLKNIADKARSMSFDEAYKLLESKHKSENLTELYFGSDIKINIIDFKDNSIIVRSENAKDKQYIKQNDLEIIVKSLLNKEITEQNGIQNLDVKKDTKVLKHLYFPFAKQMQILMKKQNFYIVIDEINRGNISKIFGELITLIEEDKRDVYEVTLPYSKKPFKVPSNLYIIATMNSTDKSIATVDIALRRRFTFLKMKPNLELVKDADAKKLMKELNIIIEDKLGEDYMLGHSYFMKIEDNEDLKFVKEYKIKPLLEEYFYSEDKMPEEISALLKENN